jgi:hypothetical protein
MGTAEGGSVLSPDTAGCEHDELPGFLPFVQRVVECGPAGGGPPANRFFCSLRQPPQALVNAQVLRALLEELVGDQGHRGGQEKAKPEMAPGTQQGDLRMEWGRVESNPATQVTFRPGAGST